MTTTQDFATVLGKNAVDADGSKIGKVGQIYVSDQNGRPEWVTVSTGLFGSKESFAPLYGSRVEGDELMLAVSKELVKDAPNVEADGHLAEDESDALYTHYRGYLDPSNESDDHGRDDVVDGDVAKRTDRSDWADPGRDTSGPTTDDAMTRSEERLNVGTEQVATGKARLRKYIVEEQVTTTVPVQREEVRIEREPITDANARDAMSGADLSEEEHEITLHAERAVVNKETVPVERVKLGTETVTDEQQVDETVRKEQIDTGNVVDGGTDKAANR